MQSQEPPCVSHMLPKEQELHSGKARSVKERGMQGLSAFSPGFLGWLNSKLLLRRQCSSMYPFFSLRSQTVAAEAGPLVIEA